VTHPFTSVVSGRKPVIPTYTSSSNCATNNGTFCWDWFSAHWNGTFFPALVQHIELTLLAVGLGFAVSLALAVVTYRGVTSDTPVTILGGVLYAIPAIAFFQILLPVTGLGVLTVEVVLVSYTLLVLFRSIVAGLRSVAPDVLESARAMGLSDAQLLLKIELPLAVPAIIAGLRVATVTTVSLATIAAFVIPEGLGRPIFDAMDRGNFNTEFIGAGGLAIALALAMDGILVGTQRLGAPWVRADRDSRSRLASAFLRVAGRRARS